MKKIIIFFLFFFYFNSYAKSDVYSFYSYAGKDYGDVIERHILNGEEYVVTQEATYQQLWKVNPETKEKESIGDFMPLASLPKSA